MPRSKRGAVWKAVKRWIYLIHRWTGIVLCVLFAIWFVSGVVMMYVPFPSFRAEERVAMAPPIRWDMVRVGPDTVLDRLDAKAFPEEMRLGMTGGEPVYRVTLGKARWAVSAQTGEEIAGIDASHARRIAETFAGKPAASVETVDHDQWVVTKAYARNAPFWKVRLDDGAGTDIYVTQSTGEIVQNTDRTERFWNWLGAVPHWIYFEALRVYQEPWRQVVIWASGIGILGSILGVWIGILRVRLKKRYASGSVSPYRTWMKWHHVTGLLGGLFIVTWVFSGWLSMSPFGGFRGGDAFGIEERYFGEGNRGFVPTDLVQLARSAAGAHEVRFQHIGGRPIIVSLDAAGRSHLLNGLTARPRRANLRSIKALARQAVEKGRLVETHLLTKQDVYWYSAGDPRRDTRLLPVLRLEFDDPDKTWLYVDPASGLLVAQSNEGRRTYRWLFSALHSFDLPILLEYRPIRDGIMIVLSLFGLVVSISGVVVGWRYLSRRRPASKSNGMRVPGTP